MKTFSIAILAAYALGSSACKATTPRLAIEDVMELKEKTALSREEAAARLHAIADELASRGR